MNESNAGPSAALRGRIAALERRAGHPHADKTRIVEDALRELKTSCAQLEIAGEQIRDMEADLKRTHALAQHQRARVRALLDFLPDAYLTTDLNGVITEANNAAAKLLNMSRRFLPGRSLDVFLAAERMEFLAFLAGLPRTSAPSERPLRMRPRERHTLDARVTVAVIHDGAGQPTGLQWIIRPADVGAATLPFPVGLHPKDLPPD